MPLHQRIGASPDVAFGGHVTFRVNCHLLARDLIYDPTAGIDHENLLPVWQQCCGKRTLRIVGSLSDQASVPRVLAF